MKQQFKSWLISLNDEGIRALGVDEMISRINDDLTISHGNDEERKILEDLINHFKRDVGI